MNVASASAGALSEKMSRCRLTLTRSRPSCSRKVDRPNAAGALCSMMARKTMTSTSVWCVVAAAPRAMPSAAACTTRPRVAVQLTEPERPPPPLPEEFRLRLDADGLTAEVPFSRSDLEGLECKEKEIVIVTVIKKIIQNEHKISLGRSQLVNEHHEEESQDERDADGLVQALHVVLSLTMVVMVVILNFVVGTTFSSALGYEWCDGSKAYHSFTGRLVRQHGWISQKAP